MDGLTYQVESLLRDVADTEVLSRFGRLAPGDVRQKGSAKDLVTVADLEAENRIREGLLRLAPESQVVGEEAVYKSPKVLETLSAECPVWVVDPIDGTRNFAEGRPCFAMMCALIEGGETQAGWILDPVNGLCVTARRGEGAYMDGRRLEFSRPDDILDMTGSLGDGMRKRLTERRDGGDEDIPPNMVRYHCCGREYMDLALGKIHFALYGGRLMPWDHAAGTLIVEEARGYARMTGDKSFYTPTRHHLGDHILIAPDAEAFSALDAILFPDL
ncbi:MAG: inositol monophosphatase [Alphaproteobacteria bacterium]|nr:inositol monophosphatase [Alphaproteobacteria bacterium]